MSEPLLEVIASKRYDGRLVLDRARLSVRPGTVHALVGENGAGKSTLVKIAAGQVRGEDVTLARARSVGLVPQHGMLVPTLTVVENAVLGREPRWMKLGAIAERLRALGEAHGLRIDPYAIAGTLSVGEQQRAEIVIALDRGADVLLLDEPTAVLAPVEVAGLLAVLRGLAEAGGAVVLVTHKLDEVVEVADEVTVLRAGKVVAHLVPPLDPREIAHAMIGGAPPQAGAPTITPKGDIVLSNGGLELRAGEIVGIAGVEGNGQAELVRALVGRPGVAHIPDDRQVAGLALDLSVEDNLALGRHDVLGAVIDCARRRRHAETLVRDFDVRPPDITLPVRALSGGNQQKVVVARELTRPGLHALVAVQPTRGVDVVAQALIHDHLRAAAAAGLAIVVISADLDELLALCHRVAVLHRRRFAGELGGEALRMSDARVRLGQWMVAA